MADQTKIDQFINLTGVDADRARFYIESAGGNVELAISSFYEEDGDDMDMLPPPVQQSSEPTATQHGSTQAGPPKPTSRFATLANYQKDENSSSSDEGQAFYAGGSETSGQQIIGPKKKSSKKIVEDLFQSAKEHGAEEVQESEQPKKPSASKFAFKGAGYRLGETEDDPTDVVHGAPIREEARKVDMVLKLWKNGFSIDSGPLRDFKDPANKEFLDSIAKGEVPNELIKEAKGGEVNLDMEDHRTEDYVQPKVPVRAFTGEGHMLGSPAPNIVSAPAASGSSNDSVAQRQISVDSSRPTTNIQIRLADGSRLTAKLNHSHTVSDVRRYIVTARPQYATSTFILLTTFPNKELTDESLTLQQANLLNAVIVQRVK